MKKLKIICYALVAEDAGSVASGNFLILRELLGQGHKIDLLVIKDYMHPGALLQNNNLTPIIISLPWYEKIQKMWPKLLNNILFGITIGRLVGYLHRKKIIEEYARNHAKKEYDLVLFLGTNAFFRPGIKTISWPQGAPHTEWKAIKEQYKNIRFCNPIFFLGLNIYYYFHCKSFEKKLTNSDAFIVGSSISTLLLQNLLNNDSRSKIYSLPYPIDISKISKLNTSTADPKTIIWLGRIVPRKRVDLAINGFKKFLQTNSDWSLKIIGGFRYAKGYRRFVTESGCQQIEYIEHLERSKALSILSRSSFLLQTSENEDFGSAIAEALILGVPIVLGETNGTKDYIGTLGEVFNEYTPASVAEACERLALRVKKVDIKDKAKAFANKNFGAYLVTKKLEEILYDQIQK